MLKMIPKPKKLQGWQVYQQLTYKSLWRAEINEGWDEYQKTWQEVHPDEKMTMTRFEYMNTFIKEKYDNETPEMKAKVEAHRSEMKDEGDSPGPDQQNRKRQE